MVFEDKATLLVDYNHLLSHDPELAQALEAHYYRVEKYLRLALRQSLEASLGAAGADFLVKLQEKRTELGVGFYNFPRVVNIRMMRADRIGRLSAVAGKGGREGGREGGEGRLRLPQTPDRPPTFTHLSLPPSLPPFLLQAPSPVPATCAPSSTWVLSAAASVKPTIMGSSSNSLTPPLLVVPHLPVLLARGEEEEEGEEEEGLGGGMGGC